MFLHLALEHVGAAGAQPSFQDYWDRLAHAPTPVQLGGKPSMQRLDRVRANLKHFGIMPSPSDVEAFRSSVAGFFEDSCPVAFSVKFEELSMVDLVGSADVRSHLQEAEQAIARSALKEAAIETAIAFNVLPGGTRRRRRRDPETTAQHELLGVQ